MHLLIDEVLKNHPEDLQDAINQALEKRSGNVFENMIKIERIVISAYDYNLSIRLAQ